MILASGPPLVLIADGDAEGADRLATELLGHGVTAAVAGDGADALLQAGALHPHALLVAADLPVLAGAEVVRAFRRHRDAPVLFGVGPEDTAAVMGALAAGANACVARPYRMTEILPLIAAACLPPAAGHEVLEAGALRLDRRSREVRFDGEVVAMPPKEFDLLACLMRRPGQIVTHEEIRNEVWGGTAADIHNSVVVHVRRLRARLGDSVKHPRILLSVRAAGYRLVPPPTASVAQVPSIGMSAK